MTDVAIIGAGPAGSTLAAILASRGIAVLLIDRDEFPRDKVCGEFLSYDALPLLESLGVLDRFQANPRIERCRVIGRSHEADFQLAAPSLGVSRHLLDAALVDHARDRGAQVKTETMVTDLVVEGSRRAIVMRHESEITHVPCRLLIGAWGRWGRFDNTLQRSFIHDRRRRNFGFKRHYAGVEDPSVITLYSFDRGYLGVSAVEDDTTNICGLVHEDRLAGHKGRWPSFVEKLRQEEPPLARLYDRFRESRSPFLSSEPVIFRPRHVVENGVVMIGDASGLVDPLTGNGMAMAIQSAFLASRFIIRLLGGEEERRVHQEYAVAHHDLFAARIRWSRALAHLLSRPTLLDRALRAGRRTRLGEALVRRTRADDNQVEQLL